MPQKKQLPRVLRHIALQNDLAKIHKLLNTTQLITFTADSTPGFGNQAATATTILRLRTLGYQNRIHLIYPQSMTYKITTLFDLPTNISGVYYDRHSDITFMTLSEHVKAHLNHTSEMATFGMTGGSDYSFCGAAEKEGVDLATLFPLDCTNKANFVDARLFVELSAFYDHANWIDTYNSTADTERQPDSENQFLLAPVATLSDAKKYFSEDPRGHALLASRPGIKAYIQGLEAATFDTMPAYGYSLQQRDENDIDFPWNILQLICAASGVSYPRKNPLIIPVFYNYTTEANVLYDLIHRGNWSILDSSWRARNVVHDYILDLELPKRFQIADVSELNAVAKIQNLKSGDVLLLSMGSFPKLVFEALFSYSASNVMMQIFEGENTFYQLVQTSQRYFRCANTWEVREDLLNDPKIETELHDFYRNVCIGPTSWIKPANGEIVNQIAEYINNANYPDSTLSRYFVALKQYAEKNDRILLGLQGAVEALEVQNKRATLPPVESVRALITAPSTLDLAYDLIVAPAMKLKSFCAPYVNSLVEMITAAAKDAQVQQAAIDGLIVYGMFNVTNNVTTHSLAQAERPALRHS